MNLYLPDEIKKIVEGTPFNIDIMIDKKKNMKLISI